MKKAIFLLILTLTSFIFLNSYSQSKYMFAQKGIWELGGSITFSSITPVSNGNTGDATTMISFQPFGGYFIAKGFEIALIPEISYQKFTGTGGGATTDFTIYAAPSYNFNTNSIAYPYIQGQIGYTSFSGDNITTRSGLAWAITGGVKLNIAGNSLLRLGLNYTQKTRNPSGYSGGRNGFDSFNFLVGFHVFFG